MLLPMHPLLYNDFSRSLDSAGTFGHVVACSLKKEILTHLFISVVSVLLHQFRHDI